MQTNFTPEQLARPEIADAEKILRRCVHCGLCTATCPTYVTLGNELDSPRGRIYLIKDMLEQDRPADAEVALHVDRCLSCLACTSTCPSGVDYMHLIDHARVHVEKTYRRPLADRLIRTVLAKVLPFPARFRAAIRLAGLGRPLAPLFARIRPLKPLAAMLALAPAKAHPVTAHSRPGTFSPVEAPRGRVILLTGCAQPVLNPGINAAAIRLLTRFGIEVVLPKGETCCGSLVHHLGREDEALAKARHMVDVWAGEIAKGDLNAIVITASGCGTTIKDYGHMLRHDPAYAEKAALVSSYAKDVTEVLEEMGLPEQEQMGVTVAYHPACSLQHGQKITAAPKILLKKAGFQVREPAESHLCCGSAGTYNILQSEIAGKLKTRKQTRLKQLKASVVATGNIGCMTQLAGGLGMPVVHTVELLDWAYGGDLPEAMRPVTA